MEIKIDCLGEICPVPVVKLQNYMAELENGDAVTIVADHSCAMTSIKSFCATNHLKLTIVEPINGVWELTIRE